MAKGDTHIEPRARLRDPVTGRAVIRLTGLEHSCHHPYFYCRCFTPDGRRLLYVSERSGFRNAHLLEIESGESVQLTDCRRLSDFLCQLGPDGTTLFYVEDQQLHALDLGTLRERTLYVQEYPYSGNAVYPGYSDDCRQALLCQMHTDDAVRRGYEGWDGFVPQWEARPRCRLVLVDLATGRERVLLEERCWLGHPQIRPRDPRTLMYCHEGPGDRVDARIWLINADGGRNRWIACRRGAEDPARRGIVTHEYFTADGRFVSFAYYPEEWAVNGSLRMIEVDTDIERNLGPYSSYCHQYHSPDLRYVVGDERNTAQPERAGVWLFHTATGRERLLCLHGSSYRPRLDPATGHRGTQDNHPHATFSPDSRFVVFTTDRETGPGGNCAVYLTGVDGPLEG